VHIDADGEAVRRFNLDVGTPHGAGAAASPTTLVVSEAQGGPEVATRLVLFDTETMSRTVLHRDRRPLGAVAVAQDAVYFVAHSLDVEAMTVERIPLHADDPPVRVTAPVPEVGLSALAVDPSGNIYLATQRNRYVFRADGTLRESRQVVSAFPAVAVGEGGEVAWSAPGRSHGDIAAFIRGGSNEARSIIERRCTELTRSMDRIEVELRDEEIILPSLCAPIGFAWLTEGVLLVSIGGEGGAVLVRVDRAE
jgi:hypothetical protein